MTMSAVGLIWNQAILWALIEAAGVHALAAKVIATGCVFFWNYSIRHYFVFAKTRHPPC
jgi:putative flippase GtrA